MKYFEKPKMADPRDPESKRIPFWSTSLRKNVLLVIALTLIITSFFFEWPWVVALCLVGVVAIGTVIAMRVLKARPPGP